MKLGIAAISIELFDNLEELEMPESFGLFEQADLEVESDR